MTSIHIIRNTRLLVSLCMVADKGWDWGTEQGRQVEGDTVVVAATCERSKCGARLVPVWWAVGGGWWWWWLVVGGGTMGVGRWVVGQSLRVVPIESNVTLYAAPLLVVPSMVPDVSISCWTPWWEGLLARRDAPPPCPGSSASWRFVQRNKTRVLFR
jgi:hypothetical protein